MKKKSCYILLVFIFSLSSLHGQNSVKDSTWIGPAKGTLVIVGGGGRSDSIIKSFIKLAGGNDMPIIVIPTAEGSESYNENSGDADLIRKLGATNVKVLHTTDRNRAN